MAFMMPLVKQNYTLYTTNGNGPQTTQSKVPSNRRRKSTDTTDRRSAGNGHRVGLRRNAKSEGTSLSTSSPACGSESISPTPPAPYLYSKPLEIRRSRFSVPSFLSPQSSFRSNGNGKPKLRQINSLPAGGKSSSSDEKPQFSPSSRSSISSASSAESIKANGNFHTRLISRLRKTLGFGHKESRPTSS